MLKLQALDLQRGGKPLFKKTNLTLHPGQKVGLVGANGCGKSTLFSLIQGQISADAGSLDYPKHWTIAHVAQDTPALTQAALDYVLDGDAELRRIETALHQAEQQHQGQRIAELHGRLDAIDGYSAPARAGQLLAGLGFEQTQHQCPVAEFSGGWRVRLNLARALMCRSDLLLLDEPTNHLDLDAVIWLEQWLKRYPGTLILISHDRDFIDQVVDSIAHIEHQRITHYSGDYSAFEQQRAERLAQQQAAYQQQQRDIAHLQQFVDRFRAKATKARQAQSRLKALERLERIAPAHVDSPFRFAFRDPAKLPRPLLTLSKAAVGYQQQALLQGIRLSLEPGSRLGLLGRNGAGKSTLIKLLAGELPLLAGQRLEGQGLVLGYFAQHQLEQLRPDWSPLHHLQQLAAAADGSPEQCSEPALRDYLGGFGFAGDMALAACAPFSGGEKARLVLALLIWQRPNVLLLDEPTNHLDLGMREALTYAIQTFTGALVVVSHDRHLLRSSCDELVLVHDGQVSPFDGDLDDYRQWLSRAETGSESSGGGGSNQRAEHRERKRREARQRNELAAKRRPLEHELRQLERQLEQLSLTRQTLEQALSDPDIYQPEQKAQLHTLLQQQAENQQQLAQVEEAWLDRQTRWETLND